MTVDLTPIARIPAPSEIAGFTAVAAPFLISTSSSSSKTVNGELVDFAYRDWFAVGGGAVAIACGIISLLLLRRRTTNRPARIAIAAVLIALGALHVSRGFGLVGRASSTTITTRTVEIAPAVDVEGPARRVFEAWAAGRVEDIYRDAHPDLRAAVKLIDLQRFHHLIALGFGKLARLGELEQRYEDPRFVVTGDASFERGTVTAHVEYVLVDNVPRLVKLDLNIPKALQREPEPGDADAIARAFLDELLTGRLDRSVLDLRLIANLAADFESELGRVRDEIGEVRAIGEPTVRTCEHRCLTFQLTGAKRTAKLDIDLEYAVRTWSITSFDLGSVE
jgi:hypothetical protein